MKRLIGAAALCLSLTATAFAAPTTTGGKATTPARQQIWNCVGSGSGCKSLGPGREAHASASAQAAEARQALRDRQVTGRVVDPVRDRAGRFDHAASRHELGVMERQMARSARFRW